MITEMMEGGKEIQEDACRGRPVRGLCAYAGAYSQDILISTARSRLLPLLLSPSSGNDILQCVLSLHSIPTQYNSFQQLVFVFKSRLLRSELSDLCF